MPLAPGTRLGPYEIVAMIGEGGMGQVYRARDSRLGRDVAIKVLPEQLAGDGASRARFESETKAVAALAHPNIMVLYDVGFHEGTHYAVTEFLEGETLHGRLSRGPLPWGEAIRIGVAIADGLAAAHARGIVHRDIKPGNLFLTTEGRVKILDFGLARRQPQSAAIGAGATVTITAAGVIMGTIGYMSPEQVKGETAEATSDIFSLGVVLYEMVSGRRPFGGNSAAETISSILKDEMAPLATSGRRVPAGLERAVARCLEKDPARRFPTAADLSLALHGVTGGGRRSPIAWPGRRILLPAAAALLLTAAAFHFYRHPASGGATIDSVAVLPFVNVSGTPDADYLSDGMTESLIGSLSQLPDLKVMSRSAVFRYQGKNVDARAAGSQLGVRAVLTGRITQRSDRLAVSVDLIDVADNSELWGEQYNDRNVKDALTVEQDIARQIVDKLKLRLNRSQASQLTKHQTANPEAYQLYLKGRYYAGKFDPANLAKGRDFLRQAIAADPAYALAYDGLAYYYELLIDWFEPAGDVGPKALAAATKALELDPDLVEGHVELAAAHMFYDFDWPEAERLFRRALELNPNYAPAHEYYAWYLIEMGRQSEGLAEIRKAEQLDPLSAEIGFERAWFLVLSRQYDEALREIDKCVELDPNQWMAYFVRGQALNQLKRYPEAITALKKAEEILGPNPSPPLAEEARVHAFAGRRTEALQSLERLKALSRQTQVSKFSIATVYAALGEKDEAFRFLDEAYREHAFMLGFLKVEPALDPLRTDPRFQDLLRKMRL